MNVWGHILKLFRWKVDITAQRRDKCVICVAPHTSNWDFILGLFAYKSLGREANFLMKEFWFFFPLKYLLRSLGGIPVPSAKNRKTSLTQAIVGRFRTSDYINLAVTPEGTRSAQPNWHTGFLHIAYEAEVPVQFGVIDYSCKTIIIKEEFTPTGDIAHDMAHVSDFYRNYRNAARYPEKFKIDE